MIKKDNNMKTDTLLVKQFGENGFKHMSASEVLANLPSSKGQISVPLRFKEKLRN
jgi:hypothetical protein